MKKTIAALLSLALVGALAALPVEAAGLDGFRPTRTYSQGLFQDVGENDWFALQVAHTYELGLMNGTGAHGFSPAGTVNLATVITLAARLHAAYYGDTVTFDQSQGANWYDTYVAYGAAEGFCTVDHSRDYAAPVTRGELAEILAAALPREAFEPINPVADGAIADVDMDDPRADAIYALYRAGVLTGTDAQGAFAPQRTLTRAELAAVIARVTDPGQRKGAQPLPGGGGHPPAQTPVPAPDPGDASADDDELDQTMLRLVNEARAAHSLPPLTLDDAMVRAANLRAGETVEQFSHTRPDGSDFSTALTQAGVSGYAWGENIAYGQSTPGEVMDGWMESPGHRNNILDPGYTRLGVGVAYRGSTPYWVQLFSN